jgi:hypothetical protein
VSRLVWIGLGAVVGVVAVRKAGEALRRTTPESVADAGTRFASAVGQNAAAGVGAQVRRLADAVQDFAAAVRESAAEREELLRAALGVDVETGGLDPDEARHLLEHPTEEQRSRRAG